MASQAAAKARGIIYLVRHGECTGNILKKHLAPEVSVLTDQGKLQLHRNVRFTKAYSSDTARATETAKIIISESAVSKDLPVLQNALLREKHMGIYEGKDHTGSKAALIKSGLLDPMDWTPEGGESRDKIDSRIKHFFQEIFATVDTSSEAHTILAVTHSLFLLYVFKYLSETPTKYLLKNWTPEYIKVCQNTGYFQIAIQKCPLPREPRELEILTAHGNDHLKTLKMDREENDKLLSGLRRTEVATSSRTKKEI